MLSKLTILLPLPLIAIGILGILDPTKIAIATVLALIPVSYFFKWPQKSSLAIGVPLIVLAVSSLFGLWTAYDPLLSIPMILTLLGSVILYFAIVHADKPFGIVARALTITAALISGYFITQYAHFNYELESGFFSWFATATSARLPNVAFLKPHPNAVASFAGSCLLLSAVWVWYAKTPRAGLFWSGVTALLVYALLVSGSRGVWFALFLAVAVWGILSVVRQRRYGIGLTTGLIILPAAGVILLSSFFPAQILEQIDPSHQSSLYSRLVLYHNSLNLFWDYPFTGFGPGDTFAMMYSQYQLLISVPYLYYAHNLFLAVGSGFGLVGLIALCWLIISFLVFVFQIESRINPQRVSPFFRAVWLGVTVIFVHGLVDSAQFSEARWSIPGMFTLLALTVVIGRPSLLPAGEEKSPLIHRPRWSLKWMLLAAAVTLLLLTAGLVFRKPVAAAWYANLGAVAQAKAELSAYLDEDQRRLLRAQAQTYFIRALNENPHNETALRRLGMLALNDDNYGLAIEYLEQAYALEPKNQANVKALGYAYLWAGRLDPAKNLFEQVEFKSRLIEELHWWQWQWGERQQAFLAANANEMASRLSAR